MENEFIETFRNNIINIGIDPISFSVTIKEVAQKDVDPRIVILNYNSIVAPNEYVQDRVLIEIGVRSLREPCSPRLISSFISEVFTDRHFSDSPFNV